MKRIFLWNEETLTPIADFDFRVTIVALQAVRGLMVEKKGWPEAVDPENRILARFLDLPITPLFLDEREDFVPYESRYQARIRELTGHPSHSKNFVPQGKTFRDFAEHRLGTTVEGALFHALLDLHHAKRITIPSFNEGDDRMLLLQRDVTPQDFEGLLQASDIIFNPLLETSVKIVQMNPPIHKEFPNLQWLRDSRSIGRRFGDLVSDAIYVQQSSPLGVI